MLDKSLAFFPVELRRAPPHTTALPPLPDGWRLATAPMPQARAAFAALECAVNEFDHPQDALAYFDREFLPYPQDIARRCAVLYENDTPAGIAFAWFDTWEGARVGRLRRVALHPACQGRGLSKCLLTYVLNLFAALEPGRAVYTTTQTWSWRAVGLYRRYGFAPVRRPGDNNFEQAWHIIDTRLAQRFTGPSGGAPAHTYPTQD